MGQCRHLVVVRGNEFVQYCRLIGLVRNAFYTHTTPRHEVSQNEREEMLHLGLLAKEYILITLGFHEVCNYSYGNQQRFSRNTKAVIKGFVEQTEATSWKT